MLRDAVVDRLMGGEMIRTVRVPITNLHCLSRFHRTDSVLEQTFEGDICRAVLRLTEEELNRLVKREGAVLERGLIPVRGGPGPPLHIRIPRAEHCHPLQRALWIGPRRRFLPKSPPPTCRNTSGNPE
jgi:hypothetical protein